MDGDLRPAQSWHRASSVNFLLTIGICVMYYGWHFLSRISCFASDQPFAWCARVKSCYGRHADSGCDLVMSGLSLQRGEHET